MGLILSIETSTEVCSVALHYEGKILADSSLFLDKAHSKYLAVMVDDILKNSGTTREQLSAVAISKGPGSYTGLRIGTSLSKGICYALDIPLIAVNTLKALARQVNNYFGIESLYCPMIDARRMEVYYSIFDVDLNTIKETEAMIIDEDSFGSFLEKQKIYFFGNGSAKCHKYFQNQPNALIIDNVLCSARSVGDLAWLKFQKEEFEDLVRFEPFYLKKFIAGKPKTII